MDAIMEKFGVFIVRDLEQISMRIWPLPSPVSYPSNPLAGDQIFSWVRACWLSSDWAKKKAWEMWGGPLGRAETR